MTKSNLATLLGVVTMCWAASAAPQEYEWRDGKWVTAAPPAMGTPAGELAMMRKLLQNRDYGKAIDLAEPFLKKYPTAPEGEEVMELAGQAEMKREHFYQAYEWFEKQLNQYPGGSLSERALSREYDAADAFLKGKKRLVAKIFWLPAAADGLEILSRVAEHSPGSSIAEKSMMRIADYHYSQQQWLEAAKAYDQYLELFSKSGHAQYAMLQAARATLAQYRGPEFDETPLLEAAQRFGTFLDRYPYAARKAGVPAILKAITSNRADVAMEAAEFYKRTGRPATAVVYYGYLLDQYPQTDAAAKTRRLLGVRAEPPAPPAGEARPATEDIFAEPAPPAAPRAGATSRPAEEGKRK